jgi:dUTP pyrophosphatase
MKWIKLTEDAIEPTRATEFSAGYDFYANESVRVLPMQVVKVKTGIGFTGMPKNGYLAMALRSSKSIERPFIMPNSPAIIDADYETTEDSPKEINIILWNRGNIPAVIDKGEKFAQGILQKYYTVEDEEKPTKKRTGGTGHTGN